MKKLMVSVGAFMVIALSSLTGAQTVSAQVECDPTVAHAHVVCGQTAVSADVCEQTVGCVCDRGYHPRDRSAAVSASNPCVANERYFGTGTEPLCGFGSVRNAQGRCRCPDSLGAARAGLDIRSYSVASVRMLVGQGLVENPAGDPDGNPVVRPLISESRLNRMAARGELLAVMVCSNPIAAPGAPGSTDDVIVGALDERTRILCGSAEGASDEQVLEDCRNTRRMIEEAYAHISTPHGVGGGRIMVTIHNNGRDTTVTIQEFVDIVVSMFNAIEERLRALEGRVTALEDEVHNDIVPRIVALEAESGDDITRDVLNATHIRLGVEGLAGFSTSGPVTGAGAASLELIFRFGDAPVGLGGRITFGGQSTDYGVGASMYLSGGAGLTFFTGGRHDATFYLGFWAEDLLEPDADTPGVEVQGSTLGAAYGVEGAISIALPGDAYWVRIRLALALATSERYSMPNGAFTVTSGAYIRPSLAIEFQPDL